MDDVLDINSLSHEMDELTSFLLKDENTRSLNTEKKEFSENVQFKLDSYMTAVKLNEKIVPADIIERRKKLPIYTKKNELMNAIVNNHVLIIIGETGSGKTTQLPQYLKEVGLTITGRIGCTQLRRMAVKSVTKRVAQEQGCNIGEEVGYTIRFEDMTSEKTEIQYMTDGILLRECTYDKMLSNYSAVILDESHERTIDTDILLAVLKWIIRKRNDLKLIISSATLDSVKFSNYFDGATVFNISGRMFPVNIIYNPFQLYDYERSAAKTVIMINEQKERGDILVFLTGEDDIETLSDYLNYEYKPSSLHYNLKIIPVYSALPWEQQALIFEPAKKNERKVIIATNIAETSLTVDGIRYVIDSGYVKQKVYNPKKDMEVLTKVRVSQAQAIQRTGRAGRVGPGVCYRLYSQSQFDLFPSAPIPEIKRTSLTNTVLLLKKIGFINLNDIDFLDAPPTDAINFALTELELFEAIDKTGHITEIGIKMASFPLEPNLAKMLIISEVLGCTEEILTIVALLSVSNIFFRPKKKQKLADKAKSNFFTNNGDLIMMMNVYNQWHQTSQDKNWCHENFINHRMLLEANSIREQLLDIMKSRKMKLKSSFSDMTPVLKSICAGFFQNVAKKKPYLANRKKYDYITLPSNEVVFIHPGSCMHKVLPAWVVYQKVVTTSKEFMRGITPIDCSWLIEMAPSFNLQI